MTEPVVKKRGRPRRTGEKKPASSLEARKMAGVVLEVLAGTMTPTEASEVMSMSVPKYYMVESRALDGLVRACEPRKRGYVRSAERELELLKKKYASLQRECARYQALARASRRAVGLRLPKRSKEDKDKKGRRKRKPTARALTLAKRLRQGQGADPPAPEKQKESQTEPKEAGSQKRG